MLRFTNFIKRGIFNLIFLIALFFYSQNLIAQNINDLSFFSSTIASKQVSKEPADYLKNVQDNKGEIDIIFSGLFLFYKTFLSSQDMNSCNFHPSCSEYAIRSIKKKGFIHGGMKAFDRLSRCNGFSPEKYIIDIEKRKLSDPVE